MAEKKAAIAGVIPSGRSGVEDPGVVWLPADDGVGSLPDVAAMWVSISGVDR
jgi:hypothetical protein